MAPSMLLMSRYMNSLNWKYPSLRQLRSDSHTAPAGPGLSLHERNLCEKS